MRERALTHTHTHAHTHTLTPVLPLMLAGEDSRILQSVIGRNCRIGKNVDILGSYILDNATIRVGAAVKESSKRYEKDYKLDSHLLQLRLYSHLLQLR